jgi:hypothetical protein
VPEPTMLLRAPNDNYNDDDDDNNNDNTNNNMKLNPLF